MNDTPKKLSTESYKGVRDFYPEDMFVQNHIVTVWKKTVESFGYEQYDASVLEPAELYKAKSGEEIVNEQTYTFKDRGDREVTLRPEMTPTVARLVAHKRRELAFPLRWYSIPNLFRYEQPQRGRLREHWQLNVDMFGVSTLDAEIETIKLASAILKNFGAKDTDFSIKINNRKLVNTLLKDEFALDSDSAHKLSKLIDRKEKMSAIDFDAQASALIGDKAVLFLKLLNSKTIEEFTSHLGKELDGAAELRTVLKSLTEAGITNAVFSPSLMRGFDYYTGTVFEVFDLNPENRRSLFGGGRYDDLLSLFGNDKIPAFGFGMGDVTTRDFLETHNLLPSYRPETDVYLCSVSPENNQYVTTLADKIRATGAAVAVDLSDRSVGDKFKAANKKKIPFVAVIGDQEIENKEFALKELATGHEHMVKEDLSEIKNIIKK